MNLEITDESNAYKYAMLCYGTLAGEQPDVSYQAKLLDILDEALAGNVMTAREGFGQLAFSLARKLAGITNERLDLLAKEHREPRIGETRLKFWSQVEQIDQTPDLDRSQATRMILRAINNALQGVKAIARIPYPDLETLKP